MQKLVDFKVRPLNIMDNYYGFTLKDDPLHVMPDGSIFHNSGKSVAIQGVVGHASRFKDHFQIIGVDLKRVEFNQLRGVQSVKGVALDVWSAASIIASMQAIMMNRFRFMEQMQVNHIAKIKNKEVDYYSFWDKSYQFDEIFELTVDLDETDRNYSKLKAIYTDGRIPKILTIEQIYEGLQKNEFKNPQLPERKGYNSYVDKNTIRKTKRIFKHKALLLIVDEMNELMTNDDYRAVDTVKQAISSIARLGRAAATHMILAMQRASGGTVSSDLKNNIRMSMILGGFDSGTSNLMFDRDISDLAKPEIPGRGFIQDGNDIIETQTYWIRPERDWVFDEDLKMTYSNPVFLEQKEKRKEPIDDTGWVAQYKLDEKPENDLTSLEEDLFSSTKDKPKSEIPEPKIDFKFGSGKSKSIKAKLESELKEENKVPSLKIPKQVNIKLKLPKE